MSGCANVSPSAPKSNVPVAALTMQSQIQAATSLEKSKVQNSVVEVTQSKIGGFDVKEKALLDLMQKYIGKKDGGDCSGFVTLINRQFSLNLFDENELDKFYTARGLKSEAMFRLYESKNLISFENPEVGDLIFFNNTTKSTKNNKKAKIITHVGIVSSVEKDGTVGFTHHAKGKNAVDFMNLNDKNVRKNGKKELNSFVATCKDKSASCLASNRFAGFGKTHANGKKSRI
ncbi:NlpC/P60 family protein [uncultured Campylobacter sp.]|uniref:NlpC/P60 family protein n=1 Tax=uncultured Campylobacter sp. TaxID=218934 RepID=UPI0025E86F3E|nr:NlpC/P60 family protein [uncultured Campylobacter sp.]